MLRPKLTLRWLLISMALVASWLAWTQYQVRVERQAIASLRAIDGTTIFYEHDEKPGGGWSPLSEPSGPQWIRDALGGEFFDSVACIGASNPDSDDELVLAINALGTAKTLLLTGEAITNETFARLDASSKLRELTVQQAAIDDDVVKHLAKFPNLEWLKLKNCNITDDGVDALSSLQTLEFLSLDGTHVTDRAIDDLIALPKLTKIRVCRTNISKAGSERLSSASNASVTWEGKAETGRTTE